MTKLYDLTQPWGAETPPWPYFPTAGLTEGIQFSFSEPVQ